MSTIAIRCHFREGQTNFGLLEKAGLVAAEVGSEEHYCSVVFQLWVPFQDLQMSH